MTVLKYVTFDFLDSHTPKNITNWKKTFWSNSDISNNSLKKRKCEKNLPGYHEYDDHNHTSHTHDILGDIIYTGSRLQRVWLDRAPGYNDGCFAINIKTVMLKMLKRTVTTSTYCHRAFLHVFTRCKRGPLHIKHYISLCLQIIVTF